MGGAKQAGRTTAKNHAHPDTRLVHSLRLLMNGKGLGLSPAGFHHEADDEQNNDADERARNGPNPSHVPLNRTPPELPLLTDGRTGCVLFNLFRCFFQRAHGKGSKNSNK